MNDVVGLVMAAAAQRRARQALGPVAAALAVPPKSSPLTERLRLAASAELETLVLAIGWAQFGPHRPFWPFPKNTP